MASYQIDFQNGKANNAADTYALIISYQASETYIAAKAGWDYYMGENTTISAIGRYYWKNRVDENTGKVVGGGFVENPYVANNKIGYSFFTDMVTQKVDTLFREIPTIDGVELPKGFVKTFGYVLRSAAERASAQAVSYIFVDSDGHLNCFSADRAMPFYDNETGKLRALIRWWEVPAQRKDIPYIYWEVYTEDGVTTYCNRPTIHETKPLTPYKYKRTKSIVSDEIIAEKTPLPIVEFLNNEYRTSDLTSNIRSKIDIIDIVQSGFANNIEDFSDAFWSIKDNIGGNEGYYQDLISEITRTKVIVADGAEMKQFQIPTEARSRFVEMIKDDLIRDGGVVDTKALTQGNLTATAIKAARANLETRVSKFEWQAYKCATEVLELYFRLQGKEIPEFDVTFNTYHLDNVTETVQNAISLHGTISNDSYLKMLKSVNIIDDVEVEKAKMEDENNARFGFGNKGIVE